MDVLRKSFFSASKGIVLFYHQSSGLFSCSSEWRRWHRWKWSDHYSPAVRPDDRDVTLCVAPSADLLYHVAKADCDDIASCSKTIVLHNFVIKDHSFLHNFVIKDLSIISVFICKRDLVFSSQS